MALNYDYPYIIKIAWFYVLLFSVEEYFLLILRTEFDFLTVIILLLFLHLSMGEQGVELLQFQWLRLKLIGPGGGED